ncbi:hypothetical protein GUY44_07045 [Pimelobacter simplex]|uniref:Uncharacterized protein n=1 Tax=Nocardioides simplex TaxID=2045 RepID=A0A0A1DMG8_NOCSI|nr:hypothetical protein [Pimelobacter simplex]AIY17763.1 hypothetical protein KR76_15140 [Pimelobacter simplex]MCG8150228.1 hypothetical protein [Pimelobacter simplex]GEB13562.1 hypothetical protein NSI01_18770 [Pimelobacter simplex]SFM71698.1 hypothetical protein SAMN05421671_3110 [Pimelobacter simplex]
MTGLHAALAALLDKAIAEAADRGARSERADVRCLDCGLRYAERQQYGCGEEGRGHSYDEDDLAEADKRGRQVDLDCVSVSVAALRALLDEHPADLPVATDSTMTALVERSSFGTPEAVALRASVSDEVAARVVARAKELEADAPAPEPSDRARLSEHLFLSDLRRHPTGEVRLHVGDRLVSGTVAGQVVRDIDDRLAVAAQEVAADELKKISAELFRDHDMPPRKDTRSYRYRDGWWDGVHHAAKVVEQRARRVRDGGEHG